jgi:hypothetical protein
MIKDKVTKILVVLIVSIGLIFLTSGCAKRPVIVLIEDKPPVANSQVNPAE